MSMLDPYSPSYTFAYDKLEEPLLKYVKDQNSKVHKVKITEYVTQHTVSSEGQKYVYAKYQVQVPRYLENKCQRILNAMFNREDIVETLWVDIKSEFYSRDFYSEFMPSGLIQEECLYASYEDAEKGKASYIFRDFNLREPS